MKTGTLFLTYPAGDHFIKTFKVSVGKGEVKQTLAGKYTSTVFLQRYLAIYVWSLTIINDFRLSNSNYKMFSYGNNIVIDCTFILEDIYYGVNYIAKY